MNPTTVIGIDPGLVHTGVVVFLFDPTRQVVDVRSYVQNGIALPELRRRTSGFFDAPHIFIEAYRPRSHFDTDARMTQGVRDIHAAVGGKVINNTGSKKVITQQLMDLAGAKNFPATNHQDLQAAARIALFGMVKHPELNKILATLVEAKMNGEPWSTY